MGFNSGFKGLNTLDTIVRFAFTPRDLPRRYVAMIPIGVNENVEA